MLRGYWLSVFAAVGLAASVAHAQPVGNNARGQARPQQGQAAVAPNPEPVFPPAVQDAIQGIARTLEATNDPKDAETERQRAQNDLKAQKDMAFWAMLMFFATVASVIVTSVGLGLIWQTLIYTRDTLGEAKKTTKAAEDAVTEAREATKAARDTITVTRVLGEAQVRAYIFCEGAGFQVEKSGVYVRPRIRNYGQSPARNVTIKARLVWYSVEKTYKEHRSPEAETTCHLISVGRSEEAFIVWFVEELDAATMQQVYTNRDSFWVDCEISYVDVFDIPQTVNVRLTVDHASDKWDDAYAQRTGKLEPESAKGESAS